MFFLSKNQWFLQFLHTCQQFLQPVFIVFTVFTNSQAPGAFEEKSAHCALGAESPSSIHRMNGRMCVGVRAPWAT